MPYVFNPFTGSFDTVNEGDPYASAFTFPANCDGSDAVDHCVYISGDLSGGLPTVMRADITDPSKMPAIGVIISKQTSSLCIVAWFGSVTKSGLTPGSRYFVGSDSKPTATRPSAPSLIQIVGVAVDSGRLLVNPSPDMVRLI